MGKEQSKKDYRTYGDYISLKNNPTEAFLMISELIDNSISSFDNEFGGNDWKNNTLEVDIDIFFNKSKSAKYNDVVHETKCKTDSYIKVKDNAFGMRTEELQNALRLNNRNKNSVSTNNRHGRGLKQCAFYFGATLKIETWSPWIRDEKGNKIETREITTSTFDTFDADWSAPVSHLTSTLESQKEIDELKLKNHGTLITIENIYSNRTFSQEKLDDLINTISFRYKKLINDGKLIISYNKNIEERNSKLEPKFEVDDKISLVTDDYDFNEAKMKKLIKRSKNSLEKMKMNSKQTSKGIVGLTNYPDTVQDTVDKISAILMKSLEVDEENKKIPLEFKWTQDLVIGEYLDEDNNVKEKIITVKFWRLIDRLSKNRGFTVYEGERAILHPPMTGDDTGPQTYYKSIFPASYTSGSTENKFAGEFEITSIGGKSAVDKSKFDFESTEEKSRLDQQLSAIWRTFSCFEINARSSDDKGRESSTSTADGVVGTIEQKYEELIESIKYDFDEKGKIIYEVKSFIGDRLWNINIYTNSAKFPKQIWTFKQDIDNTINMTVHSAHAFWKQMDKNTNYLSEILYPLTMAICIVEITRIVNKEKSKTKEDINDVTTVDALNQVGAKLNV